jgi:hypothetical protein
MDKDNNNNEPGEQERSNIISIPEEMLRSEQNDGGEFPPLPPTSPNLTDLTETIKRRDEEAKRATASLTTALSGDPLLDAYTEPEEPIWIPLSKEDPLALPDPETGKRNRLWASIPVNISARLELDRRSREWHKFLKGGLCPNEWRQFFPITEDMAMVCFFIMDLVKTGPPERGGAQRFAEQQVLYMQAKAPTLFEEISSPITLAIQKAGEKNTGEVIEEEKERLREDPSGAHSSEPQKSEESTPTN